MTRQELQNYNNFTNFTNPFTTCNDVTITYNIIIPFYLIWSVRLSVCNGRPIKFYNLNLTHFSMSHSYKNLHSDVCRVTIQYSKQF